MKNKIAVETPAYGLKTPDGSFTMPSSFWSSTSVRRKSLCAFDDSNSTPSGTMTAARPPGSSSFKNSATNNSSVFFVFTTRCRSFDVDS